MQKTKFEMQNIERASALLNSEPKAKLSVFSSRENLLRSAIFSRGLFSTLISALLLMTGTGAILSGCESQETKEFVLEHPESWQPHLKVSTLAPETLKFHESIYVPVYSHIYFEDRRRLVELAETVSFRNTDLEHELVLDSVDYYGSDGKKVRSYLEKPIVVGPMATADFVVSRSDIAGGTGANFVINWSSAQQLTDPIVEAVMISCGPSRTLSFVSRGQVVKRWEK